MGKDRYDGHADGIFPEQMSIEIYFTEISEEETVETTNLLKFVSEEKQNKLRRYRFPIDHKLSLYAELLMRRQVMHLLRLNNDEFEFGINENGKPFLPGYPSFHFNISHTSGSLQVMQVN